MEFSIADVKRRLTHCELQNEWFKVDNGEVLTFMAYLVRVAHEASVDIKYVVLPPEYAFIRDFCEKFAFNGIFYNVMILTMGETNITSFNNFIGFDYVTYEKAKDELLNKYKIYDNSVKMFTKMSIQTNYQQIKRLMETNLPKDMFVFNQFITYTDVYYALLYFVLTDKLILSEFSVLSFCEGTASCFDGAIKHLKYLAGVNAGLPSSPSVYSFNSLNYLFVKMRLRREDQRLGAVRRIFLVLCCMDYVNLSPAEYWTSRTVSNADAMSDSLVHEWTDEDRAPEVWSHCYCILSKMEMGQQVVRAEERMCDPEESISLATLKSYYYCFDTNVGYILVRHQSEESRFILYTLSYDVEKGVIVLHKKYLCASALSKRNSIRIILDTDKETYRFDPVYWGPK